MTHEQRTTPNSPRLDSALAAMQGEADAFDRARAEALLIGYDARWGSEPWEAVLVEAAFEAALVNPGTGSRSRSWRLGGKLDGIVCNLINKRLLVMEHKTSSEDIGAGSDYWKRLRLDSQVSLYCDGADALGYPVEACLYDVIKKPLLRPLQANGKRPVAETADEFKLRILADIAEEPNKYYQRGEVVRLPEELREARADAWQTAQQMRQCERLNVHVRNPDSCMKYGSPCPFFGVCAGEASIDDPALFVRTPGNVNPELPPAQADGSVLSNSRMRCFKACQRQHFYRYVQGYRPVVESNALRFGSLIHAGLEAWWKSNP